VDPSIMLKMFLYWTPHDPCNVDLAWWNFEHSLFKNSKNYFKFENIFCTPLLNFEGFILSFKTFSFFGWGRRVALELSRWIQLNILMMSCLQFPTWFIYIQRLKQLILYYKVPLIPMFAKHFITKNNNSNWRWIGRLLFARGYY
jgi:hypothetical protein